MLDHAGHFAQNLRRYRRKAKMTQAELAAALGSSRSLISHYEQGKRQPSLHQSVRIADILQISVDALCREEAP